MIKAMLFDLDGVLVDTEGLYTEFWSSMDRLYPTGVDNFAAIIKGSTLTKILSTYFPDKSMQCEICRRLEEYENRMPYRLFPGTLEFIGDLRDRGISTAIVTSSNKKKMDHLFKALPSLAELIDTVVTDEDVTASKPDPQGYRLAAGRLGAAEGEFVVVEDSLAGLEAGRRAGAYVIGLTTTNPTEKVSPLADFVTYPPLRIADLGIFD